MAESTSTLQAKLKALTHGKVDIMLNADTFKSTTQILREMSEAWEEMTDIERAAALELMGGKRQANILASVIKNFDTVEDVIKTSMDSEGSALAENEKYLDSIQGHMDQLSNSTQTMWMNFMNSETVKFFIDLANAIVKATDNVGLLNVAIGAFAAKTAFKSDSFGQIFDADEIANKVQKWVDGTKTVESVADDAADAVKIVTDAQNAQGDAAAGAAVKNEIVSGTQTKVGTTAKVASVGVRLLNSALMMVATMAIVAIISKVVSSIQEAANRMDELRDAALDSAEKTRESQESLEDYKKEAAELRKQLDSNTLSEQEAYDARAQLIKIQNELIDKFGLEAKGINLVTGEIEKQKAALDGLAQSAATDWLNENVEAYEDAKKTMSAKHKSNQDLLLFSQRDINASVSGTLVGSEQNIIDAYHAGLRAIIEDKHGAEFVDPALRYALDSTTGYMNAFDSTGLSFEDKTVEEINALLDDIAQFMFDFEGQHDVDLATERTRVQNFKERYIDEDYKESRELYNKGRQQEAISKYAVEYGAILDAQEEFYNANTDEKRLKALQKMHDKIKEAQDSHENDDHMDEWFGDIADDFDEHEFELRVKLDDDGLKTDLSNIINSYGLSELNNTQIEDMISLGLNKDGAISKNDAYTQEQIDGLAALQTHADEAGISLKSLIGILVSLGVIAGRPVDINTESVTTAVQTYSSLVDVVNAYNESISATEEFTINGAQANEDYYKSLIELGVAEEDLSACIDKKNDYIVTNAKELNRLVKASKNSIAQNVQLAKSQAKLDYYELYKEMRSLTKGRNIENKATLSYINSLYDQMTALDKTIAKYSMLEAQLLGASNAYDQLESAQAADEAADYGSKAEDLVNVLANAFNTAELGTQAAQVAIAGLIPEDVIAKARENAEDLDEVMESIYKYFTTGEVSKLFTIEFDDDGGISSVEMTKENIEEFTKTLIGSADAGKVFVGTWDEFELNESVLKKIQEAKDPLQAFADELKVTKEVAFAYLTALEKYDINWLGGDYETLLDQLMSGNLEYAINQNVKDLAELEHQAANGLIEREEYEKRYSELTKKYTKNQDEARESVQKWQSATTQIEAAQQKVDGLKKKLSETTDSDEKIKIEADLQSAIGELWTAQNLLNGLQEPTEIVLQLASEDIQTELDALEKQLNAEGVTIDTVVKLNSETGEYELVEGVEYSGKVDLQNLAKLLNEQSTINTLLEDGVVDTNTYLSNIEGIISNIYTLLGGDKKTEDADGGQDGSDTNNGGLTGEEKSSYQKYLADKAKQSKKEKEDRVDVMVGDPTINPGKAYPVDPVTMQQYTPPNPAPSSDGGHVPTATPAPTTGEVHVEAEKVALEDTGDGDKQVTDALSLDDIAKSLALGQLPHEIAMAIASGQITISKKGAEEPVKPVEEVQPGYIGPLLPWQQYATGSQNFDIPLMKNKFGGVDVFGMRRILADKGWSPDQITEYFNDLAQRVDFRTGQPKTVSVNAEEVEVTSGNENNTGDSVDNEKSSAYHKTKVKPDDYIALSDDGTGALANDRDRSGISDLNEELSTTGEQTTEVGSAAYDMWEAYAQNEAALAALAEIKANRDEVFMMGQSMGQLLTHDEASMLGIELNVGDILTVQQAYDMLIAKQSELEQPVQLTAEVAMSEIDKQITELETAITNNDFSNVDPVSVGLEVGEAPTKEDVEAKLATLKQDKAVISTIFGIELSEEDKLELEAELANIEQITIGNKEFWVLSNGADSTLKVLGEVQKYDLDDKSVEIKTTYTTEYKTIGKTGTVRSSSGGGGRYTESTIVDVNGTAHVNGTAYKGGSWGAPKTETALTGELGPEMVNL